MTCGNRQSLEIVRRRFEGVNDARRANTAGEKLRINADVRASIHNNCAGKQDISQQAPLCTISVCLVSAIKRPVDWKGVFINFISDSPENGSYRHQEPSAASALS